MEVESHIYDYLYDTSIYNRIEISVDTEFFCFILKCNKCCASSTTLRTTLLCRILCYFFYNNVDIRIFSCAIYANVIVLWFSQSSSQTIKHSTRGFLCASVLYETPCRRENHQVQIRNSSSSYAVTLFNRNEP